MKRNAQRRQKKHQNFRETLSKVCKKNPNIAESFKSFTRGYTGRPRLEHDQQDLMAAIIKIGESSSTADERCWTECMRTVTTLDDLTTELRKLGCILSHSTIHSCSLPQVIKKAFKVRWVEKNVDNWKIEENIRFGDIKFTETKSVALFLKFCKLPYFFNFSGTSFSFI